MEIGQDLHKRDRECFLECRFVEKDLATYNMLRFEVEAAGVDCPDVRVRPHHGRFEEKMDDVFAAVGEEGPALAPRRYRRGRGGPRRCRAGHRRSPAWPRGAP